jgi:hypothetical protein
MLRFIRPLAAAIAVAISAGCQSSRPADPLAGVAPGSPYKLSSEQIAKIKSVISEGLKDPESAKFPDPFVATKEGNNITVCGYVNAKNSYGGYVGKKPFYVLGFASSGLFVPMSVGGDDLSQSAALEMCKRSGASI